MVFFIPQSYDGCWWYRVLLPARANGFYNPKLSLRQPPMSNQQIAEFAERADILVWHRPTEPQQVQQALYFKSKGKKIVMDNDDTYKQGSGIEDILGRFKDAKLDERGKALVEFMKIADLVTTTTEFLADEYRQVNKNVKVLPNTIDPLDWPEPKRNETNKIRIGILGSVVTSDDYGHIKPLLKELSDRDDVQLVVMGLPDRFNKEEKKYYKDEIKFWYSLDIEGYPRCPLEDYADAVNNLRLDIALIPRKDNYFNRCKSNCKWLELAYLEVPTIAQGYKDGLSPYQIGTEHLVIADKLPQWRKEVNELIQDSQKRNYLAQNAKQYVLKNYQIKRLSHLWEEAYKGL